MRSLAHIEKISKLLPIEGAEKIELAFILGWQVVVEKGRFKEGDLVIFFEIDSFLNGDDLRYKSFEERFVNWDGKRGMRLKTIKLMKQLSQGLIKPLDEYPEVKSPSEGLDVTELLKIEKWERAEDLKCNQMAASGGVRQKPFPAFLRKTDQDRIQSKMLAVFDTRNEREYEVTIKLDGSSMTIFTLNKDKNPLHYQSLKKFYQGKQTFTQKVVSYFKKLFKGETDPISLEGVCSRNFLLDVKANNGFNEYDRQHGVSAKLKEWSSFTKRSIAVQGELISPSIQGNYEKVSEPEFYVYDIFDIDTQEYLSNSNARVLTKMLGLKYVPVLAECYRLSELYPDVTDAKELSDLILKDAEGQGLNPGVKREGLVFKDVNSEFSFKAISNSYLLKKG